MQDTSILNHTIGDDFIGCFETNHRPQSLAQFFSYLESNGLVVERQQGREEVRDSQALLNRVAPRFFNDRLIAPIYHQYSTLCDQALKLYFERYPILRSGRYFHLNCKFQRTRPGEGFHDWHYENGGDMPYRKLVTMLYLNTVEEGGETEFLYLHRRIQPLQGRLLIFPAGFTHTHRGNPPLRGDKYILTSWLEEFP
ncbi:MAG: 2OG-Fe(II) oxygenase [Synechococcus sp.]